MRIITETTREREIKYRTERNGMEWNDGNAEEKLREVNSVKQKPTKKTNKQTNKRNEQEMK